MKIGFIGLGRMGSRMVTKLLVGGHEVVVWNRTKRKIDVLKKETLDCKGKLIVADSIEDICKKIKKTSSCLVDVTSRRNHTKNFR